MDSSGHAFVAGYAGSFNFPTTPGAFQRTKGGNSNYSSGSNAFIAEFNANGSGLVYSTFLGGAGGDGASALALDSQDDVYVTGWTSSANFPTTPGAYQTTPRFAFVAKLNPTGTGLLYSTYLGGFDPGTYVVGNLEESTSARGIAIYASGIAVDSTGEAYIVGSTTSTDFPVTPGAFQPNNKAVYTDQPYNAFVSKLNATGSALIYSTYLGGTNYGAPFSFGDRATGVAVDANGNAYVTGYAGSSDFPVTSGAIQSTNKAVVVSGYEPFLSELNSAGSALVYSTYLGGSGGYPTPTFDVPTGDVANALAMDGSGGVYLAGYAASSDFPVTTGAYQTTNHGAPGRFTNAFVAKLDLSTINTAGATTTALSTSSNQEVLDNYVQVAGQPVLFTASVVGVSSSTIPTGNVTFNLNGAPAATVALDGTGSASYSTSTLSPGTDVVQAVYSGDSNFTSSTSLTVSELITVFVPPVPIVTSVSAFLAEQTQTITITGSGFGTQPAFSGTSYYMGIWDVTGGNWSAGYGEDGVTVTVSSWTDNQIVITGFGGGYGSGWQYTNGDSLTLKIWNPGTSRDISSSQQDASQSTCTITAGGGVTNCASSTTAPGVPTITWPTPAPITQDTPLGAAQLDATTTVAGTFVYTPGPGAVLTAGSQTLSVVFTPIDTVHWTTATATVTLVVNSPTAGLTAQFSGSPVAIQSINLGSTSPSLISLPFTMGSAGTLGSTLMVTQGATGLDFTDAGTGTCAPGTTYSQGDSCTVVVHFAPAYPGPRYGAAELFDSSGNPIATVYLQGTGVAPLANFPSGTQSTLTTSTLHSPQALAADGNGNVYIADTINGRILKETLAAGGYTESSVLAPGGYVVSYGIAVDGAGSVYVSDTFNGRVLKETPVAGGGYAESVVPTSTLSYPYGVAVDGSGNVYIADNGNNRVLMETLSAGTYTESTIGSGLNGPGGIAVDGAGTVYITDGGNFRVLKETPSSGAYVQRVLTNEGLSGDDEIEPTGVAVDGIGDVYISDQRYGVILKESPVLENGAYEASQIPGSGLNQPGGVAIDGSGNLYIADSLNNRVVVENLAEPPSVTFPTPTVARTTDSADDPEVVTLVNIGNASLTVSNVNSPSTFPAQSGFSCAAVPTTIGVGGLCYLRFSFAPQTSGSQSGTVTITDNSLNAPAPGYATQSIPVSGTATPNPLTITSVSAILPQQSQTITISGMGFGSHAAYTGDSNYIALVDTTAAGWNAGHSGSAITLAVSSWTDSQIVLSGFSGSYGTNGWCISPGDQLSVKVWNAQTGSGPAIYPIVASGGTNTCTLAINSVSPILPQQTQTITINGSDFGSQSAYTGDSNSIELVDTTAAGWDAGHSGSAVTLAVTSWTNTQIVLSGFSGSYGTNGWCISPGDQLSVRVWNAKTGAGPAIYPITASSATNTCTLAISSVSAILPQQTQTITINGSDFGSQSAYTGDSNSIELVDSTGVVWDAGHSGAAVPLVVSSWTDSQIVLSGFGSAYGTHGWCISPGDQLTVKVWNAQTGYGPAIYPITVSSGTNTCTVAITSVSAILPQQTQTITISGTGFGTQSAYTGGSNYIELVDSTGTGWNAGHSGSAVTLAVSSWTDSQIVLSGFSGGYATHGWCVKPGDQLTVKVWNAQTGYGPAVYPITASSGTNTCP